MKILIQADGHGDVPPQLTIGAVFDGAVFGGAAPDGTYGRSTEKRKNEMAKKETKSRRAVTAAATGAAVAAVAGAAYAAYNSRPMKTRRVIRRAGHAVDQVGRMLADMAKM